MAIRSCLAGGLDPLVDSGISGGSRTGKRSSGRKGVFGWLPRKTNRVRGLFGCCLKSKSCNSGNSVMKTTAFLFAVFVVATVAAAADFDSNIPAGFPKPAVPASNPMSEAKVELGRYLFYDARLSFNGKDRARLATNKRLLLRTDELTPKGRQGSRILAAA